MSDDDQPLLTGVPDPMLVELREVLARLRATTVPQIHRRPQVADDWRRAERCLRMLDWRDVGNLGDDPNQRHPHDLGDDDDPAG
jgi:hypothetical protein